MTVSRRQFLKGSLAAVVAGLTATSGNKLLLQGISKPTVIRAQSNEVILAIQEFAHAPMQDVLQDFEEETGLRVLLENSTQSGVDLINRLTTAFQSETSPFDVLSTPDDGMPAFMRNGWLEPLDTIVPAETWEDFPASMDEILNTWSSFEGTRYRVHHELAVGYFFTRQDWLEEKGLAAPTTWDEMVEIGKEFTGGDVWGTTDGLTRPALLYVYVAYLAVQAGGNVFDFDEGTAEALQFLYDMIYTHKIFPEAALSEDYTAQNNRYLADQVAFMRQWPFFQDVALGATEWYAPEKVAITLPPAGKAGALTWTGGHGFSIPKYAPNKEGAAELIRYLTSNRVMTRLAQDNAFFVTPRASIVEALADQDNPVVKAMIEYSDAKVLASRPFHPRVAEAQTMVDDVTAQFLTQQITLEEALTLGRELMAGLEA